MNILIDVDNTFWNFVETLLPILNTQFNTHYTKSDITHWDWLRENFNQPFKITEKSDFWQKVQPYPNAVEAINQLVKEGNKVYFLTASGFTDGLVPKIKCLLSFFDPNVINDHNIIIAKDKGVVYGEILIDDAMHNLKDFFAISIRYIQPWNHADPNIRYSVSGWKAILDLIHFLNY